MTAGYLAVVAVAAAGVALAAGCGGGSGARPTGTGGTMGGGGSTGGGGGGAGGSTTMNPALNCGAAVTPTRALITDFSDYSMTAGRWGDSAGVFGSVYGYAGTGSSMTAAVNTTNQNFHLMGTVNPVVDGGTNMGYAGAGLQFLVCSNVASYTGVRFTIAGTNTCAFELQIQTFSQRPTDVGSPPGGCDRPGGASCFNYPKKTALAAPTSTAAPITVMFSELAPALTLGEVVGLQWQFGVPPGVDGGIQVPCDVNMDIDDVTFLQ